MRTPYSEQASLEDFSRTGRRRRAVRELPVRARAEDLRAHHRHYSMACRRGRCRPASPSSTAAPAAGRFLELGDFYVNDDIGFSIHHGGTFEIEKRFAHGFSFHGSYTFSKTINNSESVANLADLPEGPDISLERAVSRQSVPHRFTLAFVSQIPRERQSLARLQIQLAVYSSGRQTLQRFRRLGREWGRQSAFRPSRQPGPKHAHRAAASPASTCALRAQFHFNERVTAEFSADFFNLFNRVNVTDLNTVYGGIDLERAPESSSGIRHAARCLESVSVSVRREAALLNRMQTM